ncbi:MAG: hypothetical protein H7122_20920 [Chitinophagaceae bacterium]|nr:hypothetical protein [Chitinophagaceae bacterium]
MKRFAAILLLCLLLFNWFGYRILSGYYEQQADLALEQKLDNSEYDETQLIEIKVPLKLPYQNSRKEFERFDGEVEVDGIHYKYVKRAVYNDSLVLLCLPNEGKMKLQSAREDFFKLVNDLQHPSQNKKSDGNSGSVKNPIADYYTAHNNWLIPKLTALHYQFHVNNSSFYSTDFTVSPEQPPEA